jgi:hypothetical protein
MSHSPNSPKSIIAHQSSSPSIDSEIRQELIAQYEYLRDRMSPARFEQYINDRYCDGLVSSLDNSTEKESVSSYNSAPSDRIFHLVDSDRQKLLAKYDYLRNQMTPLEFAKYINDKEISELLASVGEAMEGELSTSKGDGKSSENLFRRHSF